MVVKTFTEKSFEYWRQFVCGSCKNLVFSRQRNSWVCSRGHSARAKNRLYSLSRLKKPIHLVFWNLFISELTIGACAVAPSFMVLVSASGTRARHC